MSIYTKSFNRINPLLPSDAVRKQNKIFYGIFSVQYCYYLKNITPLETWNLIFRHFSNLKMVYFNGKIPFNLP